MDSGGRGQNRISTNYVLGGIVVVLVIVLAYFLTKPTGISTGTSVPSSTVQGQQTTHTGGQPTTTSQTVQTTAYQNTAFTPVGTIFCTGGFNQTSMTNSSYYANLYNTAYYNISITFLWARTTNYPIPIEGAACLQNSTFIYCVGGQTTRPLQNTSTHSAYAGPFQIASTQSAYSAILTANGTSNWTQTASYPKPIFSASCVSWNGYIYCTSGQSARNKTNSSYYSQLSALKITNWQATTPYPVPVSSNSCVAYEGYMYCVGGINGIVTTNASYYAPLTTSGIGKWSKTTSYPIQLDGSQCLQNDAYIYCIGDNPNFQIANATYYASLSTSGIGTWEKAIHYPTKYAQPSACALSGGDAYCTGAADALGNLNSIGYYAQLNAAGISKWISYPAYPTPIVSQSCVAT